jgi:molecular chaperone GrpE
MADNEIPEREHTPEAEAGERDPVMEAAPRSQPAAQSPARPFDQPTDQKADQPTDQPTDQEAEQPTDQEAEQPTEQPTGRVAERVAGVAEAREAAHRAAELEDRWLRALAELDNLRKRTAREIDRQRSQERARVAAQWLPVIDNLDLALQHANSGADAVIEGVRAVRDQAVAVLARLGFPRVEDLGTRFDPARHEAVSTAEDPEAEPGTVVAVVRPGYGGGADQLRPAAVIVSTKAED